MQGRAEEILHDAPKERLLRQSDHPVGQDRSARPHRGRNARETRRGESTEEREGNRRHQEEREAQERPPPCPAPYAPRKPEGRDRTLDEEEVDQQVETEKSERGGFPGDPSKLEGKPERE